MKIEQLSPKSCRWPTTPDDVDRTHHRFGCTEPALEGRAYCQHHHEMSVEPAALDLEAELHEVEKVLQVL